MALYHKIRNTTKDYHENKHKIEIQIEASISPACLKKVLNASSSGKMHRMLLFLSLTYFYQQLSKLALMEAIRIVALISQFSTKIKLRKVG